MSVDHRGPNVRVPQKLLHCPDVVAAHQEVGGEGVAQGVARRGLHDPRLVYSLLEGPLDPPFMEVMPADLPGPGIDGEVRRGTAPSYTSPPGKLSDAGSTIGEVVRHRTAVSPQCRDATWGVSWRDMEGPPARPQIERRRPAEDLLDGEIVPALETPHAASLH